jgi:hypothetical protein
MAINFKKRVISLNTKSQVGEYSNVVTSVTWNHSGDDGEAGVFVNRTTDLAAPSGEYVPWEDLTEEQVFSWISSIENMDALESEIADLIEAKKNPAEPLQPPFYVQPAE